MTEHAAQSPTMAPNAVIDIDILIVGAGPVGMALTAALAGSAQRVLLVDSRQRGWATDPRALALSQGSRQLLERLDAWQATAGTAIRQIHVSQRGGFGRTLISSEDYGLPALGYVMRYRDLAAGLSARIPPEQRIELCTVDKIETEEHVATVTVTHLGEKRTIKTKLIVHAEGTPDRGPDIRIRDYHQHAIVAEVRPATGHHNRAWERFTPDGPLALLPLDRDYSTVFTVPPGKAARLLALDDEAFLAALRDQFGQRLDFIATGPRIGFPLTLRYRTQLVQHRQVWIGNTAQTLHPVSGQGLNLGLRDAWELAESLFDRADAGDPSALKAYARGRQIDRRGSMAFTDGIVRLFSNNVAPLNLVRGVGLLALDLCPPLRNFVAKRMIWGARAWP